MNREQIMRKLEYLNGGMSAVKTMCKDEKDERLYHLIDDWNDIIYHIIDMIEEDCEHAEDS